LKNIKRTFGLLEISFIATFPINNHKPLTNVKMFIIPTKSLLLQINGSLKQNIQFENTFIILPDHQIGISVLEGRRDVELKQTELTLKLKVR